MKMKTTKLLLTATAVLAVAVQTVPAQSSELDQVKAAMQVMQKNMEEMQRKMDQLEREKAASNEGASQRISMAITNMEINGRASEVTQRPELNDQQDAAQRPNDLTLDPKYEGFWPVPNTPALIKFNAKPRVDVTSDSRNSGNPDRFATAQIPVVVLSADATPSQIERLLKAGARNYLTKPFDIDPFLAVVDEMVTT
jgi:CheY-like chemotaxis protein